MAEIVKITRNQPFVLYVPLVILNADGSKESVDASSLTNISVTYQRACEDLQNITPTHDGHYLVLQFDADLPVAEYALYVTAKLASGRQFSLRFKRAFAIVEWDHQSNWRDYLVGDHIELNDQPFIAGVLITDAELDRLKEDLQSAIASANQAKADADAVKEVFVEKAAQLDDVAQRSDVKDGNDTAIGILKDQINGLAAIKEQAASAARDAAEAKTAAQAITGYALDRTVAKADTIGTATDTAAETTSSSLFAWVKKVRDYLYEIVTTSPYAKETTAEAAKQAALDAKAAAQGITGYALQGSGNNTLTDIYALIGYTISEIDGV